MQNIDQVGAQGDVMFIRMDDLPKKMEEIKFNGPIVVAHSETGHHHSIESNVLDRPTAKLFKGEDELTMFLKVMAPYIDVVHHRNFDTHETIRLRQGNWKIKRQREYTPAGYRRVED